jgi:sigma-B regulation protein RsbU (phosphoserine phosphatase)
LALTAETILLERRFRASAEALKPIRDAVRKQLQRGGCSEAEASDVALAIDEACQNIIRHAYRGDEGGVIDLRLEQRGAEVVVSLRDHAPPSDPECLERLRNLDEVRPGGLGTHLMKSVMDEVGFVEVPEGAGNLLRMTKHIERGED